MSEHLETCDRLIQRIDEVDTAVDGMMDEWKLVEEGGKSLKGACEQLLEERVRMGKLLHRIFLADSKYFRTIS